MNAEQLERANEIKALLKDLSRRREAIRISTEDGKLNTNYVKIAGNRNSPDKGYFETEFSLDGEYAEGSITKEVQDELLIFWERTLRIIEKRIKTLSKEFESL